MKWARLSILLALACAASIAVFDAPASAERARQLNARVSMTVDAGFNSYVKENAWIPLRITLVNSGDPIEGEVVVTNTSLKTTERFAQPVLLGRNARRQVTLYVPPSSDSLEVQLVSGDEVIAAVTPVTRQLIASDRLVVIASDPPDAFNFIGDVRTLNGNATMLAQLRLDQFPDRTAGLDMVDVIVFNSVDTSALTPSQLNAIKQWVVGGGHLILAGGPNAALVLAGLTDIAPGRPGQALVSTSAAALEELAAPFSLAPLASAPTQTVSVVRLQPTQPNVRTLVGSRETPLILRREIGRGLLDQLAFDPALAPLRDWPGRAALFTALLGGRMNMANDLGWIGEGTAATFAASALSAASPPSALVLGGFFALYVIIIGPLNFLILRRVRRLDWAWVTVPLVVVAFTLLGLLTGFRLRGNNPHVHRLSVTLGDVSVRDARAFSVYGLFSPRRLDADFEVGRALAQLVDQPRDANGQSDYQVTHAVGAPSRIYDMPLSNNEVRTVYARDGSALPAIGAVLRFTPGTSNTAAVISGDIRNDTPYLLSNCVLLAGKDYQSIGDLAPGATASARLNLITGHPQSLVALRSINASRERLTGGRVFSSGTSGRILRPISSGRSSNPLEGKYPFEQNAPPIADALVNWQDFSDEPIRRDAQFGLVTAVFGAESAGPGVYLGCWEQRDDSGAQVAGGEYTDRALRLWHLPVEEHLAEAGEALPPDIFTWNIVNTSSSAELNDNGLTLEPGKHIIALTPWLGLRTTNMTATITLNIEFDAASTSLSGLRDTRIALYNWRTRSFDEVVSNAAETAQDAVTGPYLSAGGQIVMRFESLTDSLTLRRLAPEIEVSR